MNMGFYEWNNILICRLHLGACLWRTKFGYGAVEKVDLVVKVDN